MVSLSYELIVSYLAIVIYTYNLWNERCRAGMGLKPKNLFIAQTLYHAASHHGSVYSGT